MNITGLILAAGMSTRMGQPKMLLPWASTTVIGQVVTTLARAGLSEILAITGGAGEQVELELKNIPLPKGVSLCCVFNPDYAQGEMLSSFQIGLASLGVGIEAALVVLGDQPQIESSVVSWVVKAYQETGAPLVVPSFRMRRGHPWLIDRSLWDTALALKSPQTLRDYLQAHASQIHYVPVETDSILHDLDTPGEYARFRPTISK